MTTTGPYYRHTDPDDPATAWTTHRNRSDLAFWTSQAPADNTDIDTYTSHLAARTATTRTTAFTWLSIITLLRDYPRLRTHNHHLGLLDLPRLTAIEHSLIAVTDPEIITEIDIRLTDFLTPTRPAQILPGAKTIRRFLRQLLSELDPPAAEHDTDPIAHGLNFRNNGNGTTHLYATLPADEATEIHTILTAAAAAAEITLQQALLGLIRGEHPCPKVVFNLYGPAGGAPTYLAGAGYLDDRQARAWWERVTHTRDMDAAATTVTQAYRPSEEIIRVVKGRDGSCRGPEGCTVDAEACDVDHVINHAEGGVSASWNLQALCRRHHLMKTRGDLQVRMDAKGVCIWRYPGGDEVITYPQGPLTTSGRLFAQSFAQHRTQRINNRRQTASTPRPTTTEQEPPF